MSAGTDVATTIENIIADRLQVTPETFNDKTRLSGDVLDADSLAVVEIAEAIEADIGVHIPNRVLDDADTVGDLKHYVQSELS